MQMMHGPARLANPLYLRIHQAQRSIGIGPSVVIQLPHCNKNLIRPDPAKADTHLKISVGLPRNSALYYLHYYSHLNCTCQSHATYWIIHVSEVTRLQECVMVQSLQRKTHGVDVPMYADLTASQLFYTFPLIAIQGRYFQHIHRSLLLHISDMGKRRKNEEYTC